MRGTPYFCNLEDTCVYQGLSEVTYGLPWMTDAQQVSQGCPQYGGQVDKTISVQKYSVKLAEFFHDFPQL
jgi:hypothetical protein